MGPLYYGGTCLQRMKAMEKLGHEIFPVDTEPEVVQENKSQFIYRVRRKLFGPPDIVDANYTICNLIKKYPTNILWLDKALTIKPETLRIARKISPKTLIAGYAPDDMAAKHNQSRAFLKGLPYYHVYFTTKSYGVTELESLGVQKAVFVSNAYDPAIHRPVEVSINEKTEYGGPVGFIGDYENERAQYIFYLAQHGIPVRIWGTNWGKKCKLTHPNIRIENKSLWGDQYARAICSFDINLGFLRKINRDLQTQRSIEIPACGAFMLMERTDEHLELFEEGKEAAFFNSKEELFEKVTYYLGHEEERKNIAQAGRDRCLRSGYSNNEILNSMLQFIEKLSEQY